MDCIVYLNSNLMKDINPTDFFKMLVKKKSPEKIWWFWVWTIQLNFLVRCKWLDYLLYNLSVTEHKATELKKCKDIA